MSEWYPIDEWQNCQSLAQPGFVFELQNAEGKSLLTRCGPLPAYPFDWTTGAVRFRQVIEQEPRHSAPLPPPKAGR